jgi:hypothetical protein
MSTTTTTITEEVDDGLFIHTIDDIIKVRPDIVKYGVTDFTEQMKESELKVFRSVDARWYRPLATNYSIDWRADPFDPQLLGTPSQLTACAVYKSLQLIYIYLQKDSPEPDGFERNSKNFQKLYENELAETLIAGIDYDWDKDDEISSSESINTRVRRLYRV